MFRPMDQVPAGCMCNIPALMPGLCIWASQIKAVTYIFFYVIPGVPDMLPRVFQHSLLQIYDIKIAFAQPSSASRTCRILAVSGA